MSYTNREPRKSVELSIQMKDFAFIKTSEESSINLSKGGAFIKMDEPYPTGTLVKFKIVTPDQTTIDGVGKVAWLRTKQTDYRNPPGMGLRFIKMNDEGKSLLEKVLENAEIIVPDEKLFEANSDEPIETASKQDTKSTVSVSSPKETISSAHAQTVVEPAENIMVSSSKEKPKSKETLLSDKEVSAKEKDQKQIVLSNTETQTSDETVEQDEESVSSHLSSSTTESSSTPSSSTPIIETKELPEQVSTKTPIVGDSPSSSSSKSWIGIAVIVIAAIIGIFMLVNRSDKESPTQTSVPVSEQEVSAKPVDEQVQKTKPEEPAAAVDPTPAAPAISDAPVVQEESPAEPATASPAVEPAAVSDAETNLANEKALATSIVSEGQIPVIIKISPAEAIITVDGKKIDTSSNLQLVMEKNKEVTITASLAGYTTKTLQFTPTDQESTLKITLSPARIKFDITSNPSGARIMIDGKFNGNTPYTFLRKKYKEYNYRIEKPGFEAVEGTVKESDWVEDGRYYVFTLNATLTPIKEDSKNKDGSEI